MSKLINFETAKLMKSFGIEPDFRFQYGDDGKLFLWYTNECYFPAPTKEELSDWLRENHRMFISITPVVITSLDDITFKGTIFYFKDCWRLAPALNSTDYDKLYDDLLYKALTLIKNV